MGKYDNYSVEDCNKCLAELNESFEKLTKQFEAKEIKRFQYNFNRKSNAKQVNEVKARLAELEKEPVEEKLFGPTDEVIADSKAKGLYTEGAEELTDKEEAIKLFKDAYSDVLYNQATGQYDDSWQRYIHCKDVLVKLGMGEAEIENLEDEISDSCEIDLDENKEVKTEDVNPDLYVYEYYSTEEDAEATVAFLAQQGRKAEIRKEGEEYAVVTSSSTEDLLEDVVDVMWSAVCSGDTNFVKNAYNKDIIKPNTRYHRFDADNSFIMGALRNKNFEMAELLKSFGEKILKAELPEYKRIMAEKEYEDETTRTAMEESFELTDDATNFINNMLNKDKTDLEDFLGYELTDDEFADKHHLRLAIEEIYEQMPEEDLVQFEENKSLNEAVVRYAIFKDSNLVDGYGGQGYFSNESEALAMAKELDADTVEERTYASEQDAEAREIPITTKEVWVSDKVKADREELAGVHAEDDYEEYEDIDAEEETISLLDIALKEVPQVGVEDWGKDNELYFVADTVKLFEALKELEVEIPKSYYENADADDWSNGIDDYLVSIGIDPEEGKGDNTYNWNAPLTHDVNMTRYEAPDDYYVKLEIHRSGDVRGNYTTAFLMRFDADYAFYETIFDVCSEECFRELKHNGKTYFITPDFWSEYVNISCPETQENWDEVYCYDLNSFEEVIKQPANESKEIKIESDDDFGILLRELDGQSLYRAHAVKTIDGQDYASYLLKDKNGLGVYSFILPVTGTEDIRAKVKAFSKKNELADEKPLTEEVEYISKAEYDELDDDFKGTVAELIQTAELRGEDPEETRQLYKDLGYDENDKTVVVLDKTGGTVLKPVKLTEAPTEEDTEYKRLCQEIEFQAEENDFTLTEKDVKAIADKMIADKFFFNHDIMADDKDENAWEEINSLIVSAIEAHPNKIEESANDKVINAVRQGLSKHDVDNLSVDEDEEGNISVMYHSDKDSFPVVQNICKVVDIDKATLIPELDKLDVGKTFLTEDWEDMEDVKTFKFTIVLDTSDPEADIFKKLTHHMEYLLDFDESQYSLSVFDVTTRTEDGAVVVEGEIEVDEDIDADELTEELTYLVVEDGWEDVEMSLASVSVKELK